MQFKSIGQHYWFLISFSVQSGNYPVTKNSQKEWYLLNFLLNFQYQETRKGRELVKYYWREVHVHMIRFHAHTCRHHHQVYLYLWWMPSVKCRHHQVSLVPSICCGPHGVGMHHPYRGLGYDIPFLHQENLDALYPTLVWDSLMWPSGRYVRVPAGLIMVILCMLWQP